MDSNCHVSFSQSGCVVRDQVSGKVIMKGPKCGRLFPLQLSHIRNNPEFALFSVSSQNNWKFWHKRLGHPNAKTLLSLFRTGLLNKKVASYHDIVMDCSTCKLGKSKILPFLIHDTLATKSFDIIHSDVWGITPVISHTYYKYFVTFIDDHSRFTWVYLLQSKSEVFDAFKKYLAYIENQFLLG